MDDLPTRKDTVTKDGKNPNQFFMVLPFVKCVNGERASCWIGFAAVDTILYVEDVVWAGR